MRLCKKVAVCITSLVLALALMPSASADTCRFDDVPDSHWAAAYIEQMVQMGIINGVGNNLFSPDTSMNANEFLTVICKEFYPELKQPTGDKWYSPYYETVKDKGMLDGASINDINVEGPLSRYDMAQVMFNVILDNKIIPSPTGDGSVIHDWDAIPLDYRDAVRTNYSMGILTGVDAVGTFAGNSNMTRAEAAVVISRLLRVKAEASVSGDGTVGSARGMAMSINENGSLSILRHNSAVETKPMGDKNTWTVFVYLCGSDLESNGGQASTDLQEMVNADTKSNVKFVVQTGGAKQWQVEQIDSDQLERWVVYDGKGTCVETLPRGNMGEAQTLADFLSWGVKNYPAEKMGVVFWDHGGGSLSGVCFDEVYDYDQLTLSEISSALLAVSNGMTDKFEFIGFDACLMGTLETANLMATYARYLYASEEVEPGCGWDYTALGEYLDKNPSADGAMLGRSVCDAYFKHCNEIGRSSNITLSVVDLEKVDQLLTSYNAFAKNMDAAAGNASSYADMVKGIYSADNYGGNNAQQGYTNLVDLGGIIRACESNAKGADAALSALDNAVVYAKNGSSHAEASGISTYYPLRLDQKHTWEISAFCELASTPHYLSFTSRVLHGLINGNQDGYSNTTALDSWTRVWNEKVSTGLKTYTDKYGKAKTTDNTALVKFDIEPGIYDNQFMFSLTKESYKNVSEVRVAQMALIPDLGCGMILSNGTDYTCDPAEGTFIANPIPEVVLLPDIQLLTMFLQASGKERDLFYSPILLNEEVAYLQIAKDHKSGQYTIVDLLDSISSESGLWDRSSRQIKDGDKIRPFYWYIDLKDKSDQPRFGKDFTVDGKIGLSSILYDGGGTAEDPAYFLYQFVITDIYGNVYTTEMAGAALADDEVLVAMMVD